MSELNKESADQEGGDERAAFDAYRDRRNALLESEGHKPGSKWHVTNAHYPTWEASRAALAQPSPKCATCNDSGQIVVSGPHYQGEFQPPEYETEPCDMCAQPSPAQADEKPGDSILCYGCFAKGVGPDHFDEAGKCLAAQAEQAEAERPEVVAYLFVKPDGTLSMDAVRHKPSQPAVAVMTVAQHERIVGELRAENAKLSEALDECDGDRWKLRPERDAANARLHEVATACATAEQQRDAALARVEQQERTIAGMNEAHAKLAGLYEAAQAQHSVPVPVVTPEMVMAAMAVFRLDVSPFKSMEAALIAALRKAAAPGKEVGHE
ncbi:TPA: hypothetical protein ACHSTH_004752 [Pseudomonas aeruginosa]